MDCGNTTPPKLPTPWKDTSSTLQLRRAKAGSKRLRGISNPDYRLREGDYCIFYVVDEVARRVDVLRVMHKGQTLRYYKKLK